MIKQLWNWLRTPSYETLELRKMFESMSEQEKRGWVFKIGTRGGYRKYYDERYDTTPNKDGWNDVKYNKNHPFYKGENSTLEN